MSKKSKIEFLNKGREAVIVFPNGGRSVEFTSKKDAFESITDMAKKKKITMEEFNEFRDAILYKKELPWNDEPKARISVIPAPNFLGFAVLEALMSGALNDDGQEVETCFKMCSEKANHGHIHVNQKGKLREPIYTKVQGIMVIESLKESGEISEEICKKLSEDIEKSTLPVDIEGRSNNTSVN